MNVRLHSEARLYVPQFLLAKLTGCSFKMQVKKRLILTLSKKENFPKGWTASLDSICQFVKTPPSAAEGHKLNYIKAIKKAIF